MCLAILLGFPKTIDRTRIGHQSPSYRQLLANDREILGARGDLQTFICSARQNVQPYLHPKDRETTFDELVFTVLKSCIPEL